MLKSICFNSNSNCYCHRTKQQVCLRNVCCQISVSLSARQKGSKMEHFHHWMFPSSSRSFGLLVGNASTGNSKLKTKSEEPTSLYIDQIFWLNITICCGQALLGILLIIATFGRKGVLKTLAYPWIPITGVLTLTFFILQWLAWNGKIRYWNSYYENYYLNLHPESLSCFHSSPLLSGPSSRLITKTQAI